MRHRLIQTVLYITCCSIARSGDSIAWGAKPFAVDLATATAARKAIAKGLAFLERTQGANGAWRAFDRAHPAITALALKCFAQDDRYGSQHRVVARAVEYLLTFVHPDGGLYVEGEGMRNYETSVALMALAAVKDTRHAKVIRRAQEYLKMLQWDGGEGYEAGSSWYGGAGYGKHQRPDLSNTQLMLEALAQSGLPRTDPVYQKALVFVSRCQMLGKTNDQAFAVESVDGGFIYTAANGGESKAGTHIVRGRPQLRSYGSMTYAGFKSMLYAGLSHDDPRVVKAVAWIARNYTLDRNPNLPDETSLQGLYYYFHTFARALHAWGEETIRDARGQSHRWRKDLCEKLVALQRDDGSWVNSEDRWYEGNPQLVTAYAVLAMQTALGDVPSLTEGDLHAGSSSHVRRTPPTVTRVSSRSAGSGSNLP